MQVKILFTRSNSLGSRFIRRITGEEVSHCAIVINGMVFHSTFSGITLEFLESFLDRNTVVYALLETTTEGQVDNILNLVRQDSAYDFGAFFYLGLRALFPKLLPKQNLWQTTGMFLCTELITMLTDMEENSILTPGQLYGQLLNNKEKKDTNK